MVSRRVLHVTESYGGGVASAIDEYLRSTPELNHLLLRHVREKDHRPSHSREGGFSEVIDLPRAPLAAARTFRSTVARLSPDVVHAHSSIAGAIVRASLISVRHAPRVVYTPHCFAFEREDVSAPARELFRFAERALATRTDVIAACSKREESLARSMAVRSTVLVPNVCGHIETSPDARRPRLLVGAGRLGPQKNPELFARVIRDLSPAGWTGLWVGGELPGSAKVFDGLPVEVTGWLPRETAIRRMQEGSVYFHCAAWEGFPMAILEASEMNLPIVAHRISALAGMPDEWQFSNASRAATAIEGLARDPSTRSRNAEHWRMALSANTREQQRGALIRAYGMSEDSHEKPFASSDSSQIQ